MLREVLVSALQSKNLVMLITVIIYVASLCAVMSGSLFSVSIVFTLFLLILLFKNYVPIKYVLVWCAVFYLGVINTSVRLKDVDESVSLAPINAEITGKIVSIPQGINEGKPKFFFKVDEIYYANKSLRLDDEKVLVTINNFEEKKDFSNLRIYNSLKLNGRLATPFKAGNPSQFDYGNYLRNYNTYCVFYAKDYSVVDGETTLKEEFVQNVNKYREKVLKIHSKYLKSPYLEILGGIVFGDDAVSPSKDIKQSFVNSGLLHILAASGMNVAFIYTFFFMLVSLFRIKFKIKVFIGMAMVIVYSLMTGLGASVIRATAMLVFVLIGKLIDREAHSISLLSFVALLMLIYNPMFINDVGFQLSFIVTFGLLVMTPLFLRFKSKILNSLVATVTVPIIAQLWVIPIQIFYFNNISIYSVFANIMSVPIVMVLSFGGFVSSLLSMISPIANFVCEKFDFVLNPLLVLLVNISDFWGRLPNSTVQTSHPSVIQLLLYYSILLLITALFVKDLREKYFNYIKKSILFLLVILLLTIIPVKNSNLDIISFDVGNADCFLIKTPDDEYIMIDSGRSGYNKGKSQAEIIVLKYLKDRGIKNLKSIIVTHFDNDHCGGVVDLLNGVQVEKIYVNTLEHSSGSAKKIYKTAEIVNTNLEVVHNNQVVYDKSGLSMINYVANVSDDDNENSIITLLKYNDFTMLFTGDAGVDALKSLLKNLPKNITVLKVPHHGALGSVDKFVVDYFNPKYSIISVGENKFGHPALYTLSVLKDSKVLRTDIDNSILIKVNKRFAKIFGYDTELKKYVKKDAIAY